MNEHVSDTTNREIVATRTFNAPRELVFKAWSQPEHLMQWWGPTGFTNTFHEFDFRPGGAWRFTMHGPDGVDYPTESIFVEIVEPERIVFNHLSEPKFQVTATFLTQAEKTQMTFHMVFDTVADYERVKHFAVDGNRQTLDRLEALVAHWLEKA